MAQRELYMDGLRSMMTVLVILHHHFQNHRWLVPARSPALPHAIQHSAHSSLHHESGLFHGLPFLLAANNPDGIEFWALCPDTGGGDSRRQR
jgi:hypothetical protein